MSTFKGALILFLSTVCVNRVAVIYCCLVSLFVCNIVFTILEKEWDLEPKP